MNNVIKILMERDGMTKAEATDLLAECRDALLAGDEYAIEDYLGLEDDYIFDVLDMSGGELI